MAKWVFQCQIENFAKLKIFKFGKFLQIFGLKQLESFIRDFLDQVLINPPNLKNWNFGSETPTLPFFVLINLSFLPISRSSVGKFSKPRQESLIVGSQVYKKGKESHKNLVEK